jgi:hypothetical protein
MKNDKPIIVPVALKDDSSRSERTQRHTQQPSSIGCRLKIKDLELNIYNNVSDNILQSVLKEVGRYAR